MSTTTELVLRSKTIIEEEARSYFEAHEIPIGDPIMVPKRGDFVKGDVILTTNVYGIVMKPLDVYRYNVSIFGFALKSDDTYAQIDYTKRAKNEAFCILLRDRCRDIFNHFENQEKVTGFLKRKRCMYYDLRSILFSLDPLDVKETREFIIQIKDIPTDQQAYFGQVEFCKLVIRSVVEDAVVHLGDFTTISDNLLLTERSLMQFLDLATSQYAMFNPMEHVTFSSKSSYLMNPAKYFKDCELLFNDTCSYLACGAQKGTRVIEGPKRGRTASVIIEVKKTAFHGPVSLLHKVQAMIRDPHRITDSECDKLTKSLKGLTVETCHTRRVCHFTIHGFSRKGANSIIIMVDDKKLSVQEYFMKKYNIRLIEQELPLVETLGHDKKIIYIPLELCVVSDNQRVNSMQQTPSMVQQTIRKCAVNPAVLREQIAKTAESLHLFDSEWLQNAQIQVVNKSLSVAGRKVTIPELEFNNQVTRVDTRNFTWNGNRYLSGSRCRLWAAYAFIESNDRLDNRQLEQFLSQYVNECQRRGIQIDVPAEWDVRLSNTSVIDETFKIAADNHCDFIFVVHSDGGDISHADVKYFERKYDFVTQCIRMRTLRDVMEKGRRLTLTNIVNKTNMKLGGLNYTLGNSKITVEVLGTETLYIGFAMNHPGGGLGMDDLQRSDAVEKNISGITNVTPSVVGYAANIGLNNEFDITGDFIFQAPFRDEKVNIVADIVVRCLEYYNRGRKAMPKRIFLYRNGCSEGQFRMILQFEVPMIRQALQDAGCTAKLTIIVVNKLQNVRFFNEYINSSDRAPEQNVCPGVVVDHTVVHPIFAEFYLNSHRALQGTARIPKYTVLVDDSELKIEQLEEITFHLCFGHQIVYMPTSLPSPVYIANRYAERGRMIYQRWVNYDKHGDIQYHELSDKLCYYTSKNLFGRRINA